MFLDEVGGPREARAHPQKWQQKVRPFFDQLFQTPSPLGRPRRHGDGGRDRGCDRARPRPSSSPMAITPPSSCCSSADAGPTARECEGIRRLIQAEGFGARDRDAQRDRSLSRHLPGNWFANIREPLINTAQPLRPHPAQLRLVRQPGRALPVLSARLAAA